MHELDKTGLEVARTAYQSAIPDGPWHANGGESDVPMQAAVAAYLSATSAGVTEEQTPRVKQLVWHVRDDRDPECPRWDADGADKNYSVFKAWWGKENRWAYVWDGFYRTEEAAKGAAQADFEQRILSALEASRVAPVSQKEAVDTVTISASRLKAITAQAERYEAYERLAQSAPAGEPVGIKALVWTEYETTFVAWAAGNQYIINKGTYRLVARDADCARRLDEHSDLAAAKATAQADCETVIRSALHTTPTPVSAPDPLADDAALQSRRAFVEQWRASIEGQNGHEVIANGNTVRRFIAIVDALATPVSAPVGVEDGIAAIAAERRRQVEVEGWTPEHDDEHDQGEMARAAVAYALGVSNTGGGAFRKGRPERIWPWPWDLKWWKPADRRRNLVKAGALIAAEIDRINRAALAAPSASAQGGEHV